MLTRNMYRLFPVDKILPTLTAKALKNLRNDTCRSGIDLVPQHTRKRKRKRSNSRDENQKWCLDNIQSIVKLHVEGRLNMDNTNRYPPKQVRINASCSYYSTFRKVCIDIQRKFPNTSSSHNVVWRKRLLNEDTGFCVFCMRRKATEIDHWHSIGNYGADNDLNKLPVCSPCNKEKSAHSPEVYIDMLRSKTTKNSQRIMSRLSLFERRFGNTGDLDCSENAKKRLVLYREYIRKSFEILNSILKSDEVFHQLDSQNPTKGFYKHIEKIKTKDILKNPD